MCGIFGYIGKRDSAAEIVFEGLKRLEYRGYDSWGVAAIVNSEQGKVKSEKIALEKRTGKISGSHLSLTTRHSSLALGHTRWATHGGVTEANAHPHLDCKGEIALIHNGIVENYLLLKKKLSKRHKFVSETDSEVVVHLIEDYVQKLSIQEATKKAFKQLKGLNAVVVLFNDELIALKNGSPLVIGIGEKEYFIASDAAAILPHTKKVIFLEDNLEVVIRKNGIEITDAKSGKRVEPKIETLNWRREDAQLGDFQHFMIKEIYEQPKVIRNIADNSGEDIENLSQIIKKSHGIFFIGAGTAFNACLAGSYLFSKIAHAHVNTLAASEFNYLGDFLTRDSLIIALSQSGETIDVVEPLKKAKEKKSKIVGIVNNAGSTIWQISDYKILLGAGPEMAVASTKAYVAKIAILILLVYGLVGKTDEGEKLLYGAADEVERLLYDEISNIKKIAKVLSASEHIFTIGRGLSYQSALEAALKIKEVSYVHTEGLAGGELKHGPIALISEGTPVIVFAPNDETYEAIISNATEIKARGGLIIGIGPKKAEVFDYWVKVRDCGAASIIPNVIPAQLFGYYMAVGKKLDPDKPRNLAKSVTVK